MKPDYQIRYYATWRESHKAFVVVDGLKQEVVAGSEKAFIGLAMKAARKMNDDYNEAIRRKVGSYA